MKINIDTDLSSIPKTELLKWLRENEPSGRRPEDSLAEIVHGVSNWLSLMGSAEDSRVTLDYFPSTLEEMFKRQPRVIRRTPTE